MIRDDAKWVGWRKYELSCLHCGQVFTARRADAKFCSAVCRKANARRREQLDRAERNARGEIDHIRRLMNAYPDLETHGALALERLAEQASVTLAVRTDMRAGVPVTLAGGTESNCVNCGKLGMVSPASGLCLDCIRSVAHD